MVFRAETFDRAGKHLKAMAGFGTGEGNVFPLLKFLQPDVIIALFVGVLCSTPFMAEISNWMDSYGSKKLPIIYRGYVMLLKPVTLLTLIFIFSVAVLGLSAGQYNPFIYFRF